MIVPGLYHYIIVSFILFVIGIVGVLTRRNILVIVMSIELMLNSANLSLVAFSRFFNDINGHIIVLFVMAISASEVAVGLAIIIAVYKQRKTLDIDLINFLKR